MKFADPRHRYAGGGEEQGTGTGAAVKVSRSPLSSLASRQIRVLFGRVFATEYCVAMGEAAEARNGLIVLSRVTIAAVSHRKQQCLVAQGFAMHQGHDEEIEFGAGK